MKNVTMGQECRYPFPLPHIIAAALILSQSLVGAVPIKEDTEETTTPPQTTAVVIENYSGPFPLPVASCSVNWWLYSEQQAKEYDEAFVALPYVVNYSLPLDPMRIWPGVPLEKIGMLKWDDTLDKNPHYQSSVRNYLKNWYRKLVQHVESNSPSVLEFLGNYSNFAYIRSQADADFIRIERELFSIGYFDTSTATNSIPGGSEKGFASKSSGVGESLSPSVNKLSASTNNQSSIIEQMVNATLLPDFTKELFDKLPYAFPLPVMSYGVPWWAYSSKHIQAYDGDFEVMSYVHPDLFLPDPFKIWPRASLKDIVEFKWEETLRRNSNYSPQVRIFLLDWFQKLVDGIKGKNSQRISDFYSNENNFRYIQSLSDVQSIAKERARLAAEYDIFRFQPSSDSSGSQVSNHSTNSFQPSSSIGNVTTLLEESEPISTFKTSLNLRNTISSSPVSTTTESAPTSTITPEENQSEDFFYTSPEEEREFEQRAVNLFYRLAMNAYLSSEERAKDAIKCVLGLECGVPSFIKESLQKEGIPILVHGKCSPGACYEETEELARTFRDQLADTYPDLFKNTLNLIKDLSEIRPEILTAAT